MKKTHRRVVGWLSAGIVTYLGLFFFGWLDNIIAYDHPQYIPTIKLYFLNTLLVLSMFFATKHLINDFFTFKSKKQLLVVFSVLTSLFLSIFLISFDGRWWGYVSTGAYLRDVHGINWFYMDWSGWGITFFAYLWMILSFFFYCVAGKATSILNSRKRR